MQSSWFYLYVVLAVWLTVILMIGCIVVHNGLCRMHFSILWYTILSRKHCWLTRVKYMLDHGIRQNHCQCLLQVTFEL